MRILFVAIGWSSHTARWINQLDGLGWDIHLFPVHSADDGIHPELKNITLHDALHGRPRGAGESLRVVDDFWPSLKNGYPLRRGAMTARRLEKFFYPQRADKIWRLAYTIKRLRPDIIHCLTIWESGEYVYKASRHLKERLPPWMVTAWGSDIYLFPRLAERRESIKAVLSSCDYFTCDCERDLKTARELGFKGEFLPVLPVAGGLETERLAAFRQPGRTSARRLIMLKGYQDFAGRALVALRAVELCAEDLKGYCIAVYLADQNVRIAAEIAAERSGLPIEIIPQSSPDDILRLHGQARISIGLSISDGLPLSVLEAMAMGSFPVQSNTSCSDEYLRDGETCLLVPPEDPQAVADAIRRALKDDALVDRAGEVNPRVIAERLDYSVVQPKAVAMYEEVARRARM
ncbi:MAG TPA: glycosyltransferase family 4 protein [Pyrinomonadaceae bacterium]